MEQVSTGLDTGLLPTRRQAITWTIDDLVPTQVYINRSEYDEVRGILVQQTDLEAWITVTNLM